MNAGCICCSLVGDFGKSLKEVMEQYHPDRILIEPSGVGKLSDVCRAVNNAAVGTDMEMNSAVAVVDATKAKMYIRNFGEFFLNQIENAGTILLTRTDKASKEQIDEAVKLLREHNSKATIITTPLAELDGKVVLDTIEGNNDLQKEMLEEVLAEKEEEGHHHHHHHHHDEDHDDHDEDEDEDEDDDDDDEDDHDGHEHHHHHHHHEGSGETADENGVRHHHSEHDADEVFGSWGMETPAKFTKERIEKCLEALGDSDKYGVVLRAKGMVPAEDGTWIHFDYVPEETNVRSGSADVTGKICVIGANLNDDSLDALFENRQ
jgi:G3E family GTPase